MESETTATKNVIKEKIRRKNEKSGEKRPDLTVKSTAFFIKSGYRRKNVVYLRKSVERI